MYTCDARKIKVLKLDLDWGLNKEDPLRGPFMVHIPELAHLADTHESFWGPWSLEGLGQLSPLHGW